MWKRGLLFGLLFAILCVVTANAQDSSRFPWTFLPDDQMDEIIGEASGETAWNTIVATGGYNRDRPAEEYAGTFQESQYIYDQLKLYGLPGAEIVRFPSAGGVFGGGGKVWDGIKGELWEISPRREKLASYQDLRAMLIKGSNSADVEAELVWVGMGTKEEIERAEIEGKIVVTEGYPGRVHQLACQEKGALGLVVISTSRAYFDSLQIPWSSLGGRGRNRAESKPAKFGFYLPFREGFLLKRRLLSGEKILVRAQVETQMLPYEEPTTTNPALPRSWRSPAFLTS